MTIIEKAAIEYALERGMDEESQYCIQRGFWQVLNLQNRKLKQSSAKPLRQE